MELLQFRYFLEAARYENLTRAADELHIAQPALSQSIMRLENELGVKLFDRRNHHVYLNDQGKLLRKRLIPLMESIDSLKDELWESVCSSEKTISLNFFAASQFITNCIIAFHPQFPVPFYDIFAYGKGIQHDPPGIPAGDHGRLRYPH